MIKPFPIHVEYLSKAIECAQKGRYLARPNPCVGALIVKDGQVISEGFHSYAGGPHAEIEALGAAGDKAEGATLYVTLEPCNHHGKTPPCVDAIIRAKIKTCVVASVDPNPLMQGKSFSALSSAGIEVIHIPMPEADMLNPGFLKRMQQKMPYVRAKVAASIDGQTAMKTGESKWITGTKAREDGHLLRARSGAIITGVQTVLNDDPQLNVRLPDITSQPHFKPPLKVILDSSLKTPPQAKILYSQGSTLLVVSNQLESLQVDKWLSEVTTDNVDIIKLPEKAGRLDLKALMYVLAEKEINDVLVESGHTLLGAMITENIVDECHFYLAPHLLGVNQMGMFALPLVQTLADKIPLEFQHVEQIGNDIKIVATISSEEKCS